MRNRTALSASLLLGLIAAACGDAGSELSEPCGAATSGCGSRQHCDRVSVPNRCVCDAPYTGADCTSCARGYRSGGGRCVPESISCSTQSCGSRGECADRTDGERVCLCQPGYTGNACASCADGYQDHDGDGVCAPSCGVANVYCQGLQTCSDESGLARCTCIEGRSGPECEECAPGYRPDLTGQGCVPTCGAETFPCGSHGTCVETLRGARCECDPGRGGASCDECAPTHTKTGSGACVAPLPSNALLWTVMDTDRGTFLGALVTPAFDFFPVVPAPEGITDVSYDATSGALHALVDGALVTLDLENGQATELVANVPGRALTHDPETGDSFVGSSSGVWRITHADSSVTPLSDRGVVGLAFDAQRRMLLAIQASGERFEIDPSDGVGRSLAEPLAIAPRALAFDSEQGRAYVLGETPESPEHQLERFCRGVATTLGAYPGPRHVQAEFGNSLAAGETRVLEDHAEDPPLLAYGSVDGTAQGGTLRVATTHPESVVCIATVRERLSIVVDEAAAFQLLVVVSEEPSVTLDLGSDEPPSGSGSIHVRAPGDVPVTGNARRVTLHSTTEWSELGLEPWSDFADKPSSVLGLVDWQSGSSLLFTLDAVRQLRALSWVGKP